MNTSTKTQSGTTFSIPVAAIDIGYFSVKGAVRDTVSKEVKSFVFPSQCAPVNAKASVGVGMNAHSGCYVEHEGALFFVGQDAALQSSGRQTRTITEKYCETSEYMALFLGGLHYILRENQKNIKGVNTVVINRLVGGLPLNTHEKFASIVRARFEGEHMVPGIHDDEPIKVIVRSVAIIPQPQGAMMAAGARQKKEEQAKYFQQNILVIDIGGGTTDWFLANEMKLVSSRSQAYQKGIITCVNQICEQIKRGLKDDPMVVQRIDKALRDNKSTVMVSGQSHDMAQFLPQVEAILGECLNAVLNSVQSLDSVDVIIFTGGGAAKLHSVATQRWADRSKSMILDESPVISNVMGFLFLGEVSNGK